MSDEVERFLGTTRELVARLDRGAITDFVDILFSTWRRGGTVFTLGNGGSASTAQHLAADLFKCASVPGQPRVRALSLNDNAPLLSALTNDEGWDAVYAYQLETWFRPGDAVIAVSVHGGAGQDRAGPWSQNVLRAARYAQQHAGKVLAIVGGDGGPLARLAERAIIVPSDATPQVEGLHVVVHHLVASELRRRIESSRLPSRSNSAENPGT